MPENKNVMEFTSEAGNKYTFQRVAPVEWLDIMDEVNASKEKQSRKLYTAVMENVVVQPKMKLEEFETFAEMDEVVTKAIRFQRGK